MDRTSSNPTLSRLLSLIFCSIFLGWSFWPHSLPYSHHCTSSISPISSSEFLSRQKSLASTLHSLNASAYITEPSPNAIFFTNVSSSQWFLSERPLLFIITPQITSTNEIHPKISVLAPKFESTRARLLPIPVESKDEINWIEWPEEANPYQLALAAIPDEGGKVFVDGAMRYFIVHGLQEALGSKSTVLAAPPEIRQLRERKSKAELEIMKCAHETTLLAIRNVHKHLYIGIHEFEAREMMATALAAAGLSNGHCLTLFGENAALPHGSGSDRVLGKSDFALFDCTASLLGYASDVTRTVALPSSTIPIEHQLIWSRVHTAQTLVHAVAKEGVITEVLDKVARDYFKQTGYAEWFTHRLGHGIGIEGHESPYLRGGSKDVIQNGMAFSNEPGVYIEGKVGVRLEDCFYIDENGKSVFLTQGVGGMARSPWVP